MCKYYNPYKLFVGAFIPNWLLQRSEISGGAKLCFARLAQYAGQDGVAYPLQRTLAKELGVGERQVRRYLEELQGFKLIKVKKQNLDKPNLYFFCTNSWMSCPVSQDMYDQSERTDVSGLYNIDEENHIKESYMQTGTNVPSKEKNSKAFNELKNKYAEIWTNYPQRFGSNPREGGLRAYRTRIKGGEKHEVILRGVANYRIYCDENSKTNTEFVMTISKFLGPDKHYLSFQKPLRKNHWADGL